MYTNSYMLKEKKKENNRVGKRVVCWAVGKKKLFINLTTHKMYGNKSIAQYLDSKAKN